MDFSILFLVFGEQMILIKLCIGKGETIVSHFDEVDFFKQPSLTICQRNETFHVSLSNGHLMKLCGSC